MASKKIVPASVVRDWAVKNLSTIEGLPEGYKVGTRGRLHPLVREAFNKANKGVRHNVGHIEPKSVTVKTFKQNAKGGKTPLTKRVSIPEVREAAKAAGVEVGKRGLPQRAVLEAFARGDLSSLVSAA